MRRVSFREHCVGGHRAEPRADRRELVERLADAGDRARARTSATTTRREGRARRRTATGTTLREAAIELGLVTAEEFDRLARPADMVGPKPDKVLGAHAQ